MLSRCVRSLMLVCGLTLALPPGWCCLLASQATPTATTAPRPGSCCCTCPAPSAKGQPQPKSEPAKSPTAPLPKDCPCTDRQTVLTAGTSAEQVDGGVMPVAILPALDIRSLEAHVVRRVDSDAHPPPLRLHVLHCRWLC